MSFLRNEYGFKDWVVATVAVTGIIVGLLGLILGGTVAALYYTDRPACATQARDMNTTWRWGYLAGCRVRTADGTYWPIDNVRLNQRGEVVGK